jgi:tight adherence protein B
MTQHPEIFTAAIGIVFLVAAFWLISSTWLASHGVDQRLEERIQRILGQAQPGEPVKTSAPKQRGLSEATSKRIRDLFAIGREDTWGMKSSAILPPLALVGGAVTWLLFHGLLHLPFWVSVPPALAGAFMLPRFVLVREQDATEALFNELFPSAIDMIVRMLRAGLPVTHAIRTVGHEVPAPVGAVFAKIADEVEIGMPLEQALETVGRTISLPDFRFFVVAGALQRATGGNLAASLETMATIVRQRRAVRMKGLAATAEVRVTAVILGMLPFVIVGGLLLVSPRYLDPLVHDPRGNIVIGAALISLLLGAFVLRAMVNSLNKS